MSARSTWSEAWANARAAHSNAYTALLRDVGQTETGRLALEALRQRELADEEAERSEPHPCLVGLVEQGKTSLAIRALQRRGWTMDTIKAADVSSLVNMAARLIRARAPQAGEVREYVCGFGGGGRRAVVQRSALVRLNGQLVPAVFFARHSAEGRQVIDAVTINVWRQRTKPAREVECYLAIRCEAAQQSAWSYPVCHGEVYVRLAAGEDLLAIRTDVMDRLRGWPRRKPSDATYDLFGAEP